MNCRNGCKSPITELWNLGPAPYGDLFSPTIDAAKKNNLYPFRLGSCSQCGLLQLCDKTDLRKQYDDYLYLTQVTNNLVDFYSQICERLITEYKLTTTDFILDIGGNDGSFLSNFRKHGFSKLLSVDPAKSAQIESEKKKIAVFREYFDSSSVNKILMNFGRPRLISINYTFANIENLAEFCDNLYNLMDSNTLVSICTGYHPDQFSIGMFDYIGHDHLAYLTLADFDYLARIFSLVIVAASRHEHKGGSLQVVLAKKESQYKEGHTVRQLRQREFFMGIKDKKYIEGFKAQVNKNRRIAKQKLLKVREKKNVIAIGASISTTYLTNYFGLGKFYTALLDDDRQKIGKFSPYFAKPVYPLESILQFANSDVLILAWQHTFKLLERLKELKFKGKVHLILPKYQGFKLD